MTSFTEKTSYTDYGYRDSGATHAFAYLLNPLLGLFDKHVNKFVLDLGCGNGYLVNCLLASGFEAYGIDASEEGIAIAAATHAGRFYLQDLSVPKLPDGLRGIRFDTIVSTEVIEHLYDPEGFVRFCKTILKDKGELILSTPYHGYLKNLAICLGDRWDAHHDPAWRGGHIKFWSRRTLAALLTDAGFTVTAFKGCGRFPFFWKSMIIKAKIP